MIYRPLRRLAFLGNEALTGYIRHRISDPNTPRSETIETFLEALQFWQPDMEHPSNRDPDDETLPTTGVLLMTNQCNMRCIYCYANAGMAPHEMLEWPLAKQVIRTVCANARSSGAEYFSLAFHGGGEPTVAWQLLTEATSFAREQDVPCRLSLSSNGVWTTDQRAFVCAHFDNVSLSLDGNAAVQNRQRPLSNGSSSFPMVMESIAALDAAHIDYGIRMTVTADSVRNLSESVDFICRNTSSRAIQIEPTFTCSRGVYADPPEALAENFRTAFLDAWEIGRQASRFVYFSAARPWVLATSFCEAPTTALIVVPGGRLVACFEVSSARHELADEFTIGHVTPDSANIDHDAVHRFNNAQQNRRAKCRDCFCFWHCCGDCAVRSKVSPVGASARCTLTRNITRDLLALYIAEGNGVWTGNQTTLPT